MFVRRVRLWFIISSVRTSVETLGDQFRREVSPARDPIWIILPARVSAKPPRRPAKLGRKTETLISVLDRIQYDSRVFEFEKNCFLRANFVRGYCGTNFYPTNRALRIIRERISGNRNLAYESLPRLNSFLLNIRLFFVRKIKFK